MKKWMNRIWARAEAREDPHSLRLHGHLVRAVAKGAETPGEAWDFEVLIAQPGYSGDGEWFLPRDVLREAAPLFEGAQAFANHTGSGGPDIRNLVGWHREVHMGEEGLLSTFAVSRSAAWFQALAHDALARGLDEPFGFSFDVLAQAEFREEADGLVLHFEKILAVHSVDVVHKGKLGGGILGLAANHSIQSEVKMFEKLGKKLKSVAPESGKRLGDAWTPQQFLAACEDAGLELDLKKKGEDPAEDGAETRAAARGALAQKLAASALPEAVQEKMRAQLGDGGFTEEEIEEAIRVEAATLEKLTASGALRGFGARAEVMRDEADRKRAALDGLWSSRDEAVGGERPYRFMSEAFQDFTGHRLTPRQFFAETFHYHRAAEDWNGVRRLSASLQTSTWGEAFGDSIRRAMLRDFRDDRFHQWKKIVSAVAPVKDFRTNRRVRVGGYGDLQTVAEQATYPALASPTDEEVTYAVSKRGGVEDLTWEMIQNDDMGAIRMIPQRLARAAQRTLNGFVFDFLASNADIYDGDALFHADHNNTSENELTYDNAVAAIKAMGQQTFYGEEGVEVAAQARPKYLVHPTELLEEAFEVTQSPVKVVEGGNSTQPSVINRLGVEPLWVPELADANDWYMIADPALIDTIEIGFMDDMREPELFIEDNPAAGSGFSADKIRYKIRHVYGGAVLDFRGFYRGAPA
ncbi:MAG: hypothetical protein OXG62_13520 [Nitrospinae bacterium]|nr:hypothetical protein [Nitrospinota bacterium]